MTEFYKKFEIVTVPSAPIKKMLEDKGVKNPIVLPNAVDISHYRPGKKKSGDDPSVLFVGRIGKEKKLEVLIDAAPRIMEEFPEIKFNIIGKGKKA